MRRRDFSDVTIYQADSVPLPSERARFTFHILPPFSQPPPSSPVIRDRCVRYARAAITAGREVLNEAD